MPPPRRCPEGYIKLLASGGKMFVTIGGAMSTAELGLSLAEMIRQDKIHASAAPAPILKRTSSISLPTTFTSACPITATSPLPTKPNSCRPHERVTDTCIPEMEACAASRMKCSRNGSAPTRRPSASSLTSLCYKICSPATLKSPTRSIQEQLALSRRPEESAHLRPRLGRLHPRQHVLRPLHLRRP